MCDGLKHLTAYVVGGWVWVYNTSATTWKVAKAGTDVKVLNAKFSLNWTGPFTVFAVDPSVAEATLDGRPLAAKIE